MLQELGKTLHPLLEVLDLEPFNIHSPNGTEVYAIFDSEGNVMHGTDEDKRITKRDLVPGIKYTVRHVEIESWSTKVFLMGFPSTSYNSVQLATIKTLKGSRDNI